MNLQNDFAMDSSDDEKLVIDMDYESCSEDSFHMEYMEISSESEVELGVCLFLLFLCEIRVHV